MFTKLTVLITNNKRGVPNIIIFTMDKDKSKDMNISYTLYKNTIIVTHFLNKNID